jgi:uncharacterized protein YbaP (TraB family)
MDMLITMRSPLTALAAFFALLAPVAQAQQQAATQHLPTPQPTQQVPAPETVHPGLWKVTRGKTVIYLFGTVHALPAGVPWLDGKVADALGQSDTLVTEIIEKDPAEMRKIVMATAMLPEGQSLRNKLTPKQRAAFEKALAGNGLPAAALDRFRPWYAAVALSTLPLLKSGYDPANGVDAALAARAKDAGKLHEALETPEYQLGLFNQLPEAAQKRYLNEVATGTSSIADDLAKMIREWKAGHAEKLAQLMNEDESDPALLNLLLINRNRNWAQWIKARLDKPGTVLLAVGAGHLAGKGSVQDQLARLGIKVTRVQ